MILRILFCVLFGVCYGSQIREMYSNSLGSGYGQLPFGMNTYYQDSRNQIGTGQSLMTDEDEVEKVTLQIYYECLCPDCRTLDSEQLIPLIKNLGYFLNVITYPYGNAETIKEPNGSYSFKCQHGPKECYGNKLHACVIDALHNKTLAVLFNACMMDYTQNGSGSDDEAADVCGRTMGLDTTYIKRCAKGLRGTLLLKYYGDESKKANFHYVPYILINGKRSPGNNLMKEVCSAFKNPPEACGF